MFFFKKLEKNFNCYLKKKTGIIPLQSEGHIHMVDYIDFNKFT